MALARRPDEKERGPGCSEGGAVVGHDEIETGFPKQRSRRLGELSLIEADLELESHQERWRGREVAESFEDLGTRFEVEVEGGGAARRDLTGLRSEREVRQGGGDEDRVRTAQSIRLLRGELQEVSHASPPLARHERRHGDTQAPGPELDTGSPEVRLDRQGNRGLPAALVRDRSDLVDRLAARATDDHHVPPDPGTAGQAVEYAAAISSGVASFSSPSTD